MDFPDDETVEMTTQRPFADHLFAVEAPKYTFEFGTATHRGRVRPLNEDHFAVMRWSRSREILLTNLPEDSRNSLVDETFGLIVADGVGGAAFGEFASQLALETMFDLSGRATSWVMKFTDLKGQQLRERVNAYVEQVQQTLREFTRRAPAFSGMGTTWTSAHLMPPYALIVHLGDSRAYVARDGLLQQMTRDHTLAEEMVRSGVPRKDVKRFANILTNSLGGGTEEVFADICYLELKAGDRLLLCTDGLTDMVDETDIAKVVDKSSNCQHACNDLIQLALDGGGKDNITVVLAEMRSVANAV